MMRREKINEIMKLAGVAPRDFDAARVNYERLTEGQIDDRLNRLRAGKATVDRWRSQRGPAVPSRLTKVAAGVDSSPKPMSPPAPISQPADLLAALMEADGAVEQSNAATAHCIALLRALDRRTGYLGVSLHDDIAQELEAVTTNLEGLARVYEGIGRSFKRWLRELPAKEDGRPFLWAGTEIGDIVSEQLRTISASDTMIASLADRLTRAYERMVSLPRYAHTADHPVLPGGNTPLRVMEVVEALARVENEVADYRPDVIVAVNDEGRSIGQVIAHHLGLGIPMASVDGSADVGLRWHREQHPDERPAVVCVVGHVAKTGATLSKTMEEAWEQYRPDLVFGTVLAASADAVAFVGDRWGFCYHHLLEEPVIKLGFDASKGVTIDHDNYLFAGTSDEGPGFPALTGALLSAVRVEMAKRFPVSRLPRVPASG